MWYKLDFRRLGVQLLPTFLRAPRMVAWVNALTAPMEPLHDDFKANRDVNLTRLNHNSQVYYLRKILNDTFDPDRRIKVLPPNTLIRQYIFTKPEYKTKYLRTVYLHPDSSFADKGVDFIVQIPTELVIYQEAIESMTDYYRLAGTRFKIVIKD